MAKIALLCSGQGAQKPGMAAGLGHAPFVEEVFEAASDICGFDVRAACDDAESLADALRVQPALCATSIASARLVGHAGIFPDVVTGFSLGQVAALNVAGMLSLEQTFSLCTVRARAMAEAVACTPGAMCALTGGSAEDVQRLIDEASCGEALAAANFNAPGQIVVSGARAAVERAADAWRAPGRRATMLAVAGAFHSPLMEPASRMVAAYLENVSFAEPCIPLICNVDARPLEARTAARHMALQVSSPVMFERSVVSMMESGVDTYAECGSGSVLCSLVRRMHKDSRRFPITSSDDAWAAAQALNGDDEGGLS